VIPDWQADDALPQRALNTLGALKIHLQRTQFVLSAFNTGAIAVTAYYSAPIASLTVPGTAVRPFATIWGWLAGVALLAVTYLVVDRTVIYPAEVSYNSHQASRRDRNPGFDMTVDSNERIRRLEDQLVEADGGDSSDER